LDIAPQKVRKNIDDYKLQRIREAYIRDPENNGAYISLFDTVPSNWADPQQPSSFGEEEIKGAFDKIEEAFKLVRYMNRRLFLGKLLTLCLAGDLIRFQKSAAYKKEDYSFIDDDLLQQYGQDFSEKIPSHRKIAELLGKDETQISRAFRDFKALL
jgi:hypothetical protein